MSMKPPIGYEHVTAYRMENDIATISPIDCGGGLGEVIAGNGWGWYSGKWLNDVKGIALEMAGWGDGKRVCGLGLAQLD